VRYRNLALLYGGITLLWLQLEEDSVLPAVVLGLGAALLLAARFARPAPDRLLPMMLTGAATGLLTAPLAAALMILKTGLHFHAVPDYPPAQILAVLGRAPLWALAGALAGIGLALATRAFRE